MTYIKSRKGWMKEYKGTKYAVSCRQLQCEATKEASWEKANLWWERKQQELDARTNPVPSDTLLDRISALVGTDIPDNLAAQILALRGRDAVPVKSIKTCVEEWQKFLTDKVNTGSIDVSRRDAYCRYVKKFTDWIGEDSDVKVIDSNNLDEFWAFLGRKKTEGVYSAATAQQALMTAKQLIKWSASKGYLTLPGNFAQRHLKFKSQVKAIEVFTVEEIKALFAVAGHEKSKLYVLLMLNTGMYQSDISDLGDSEVDWAEGIISRPRSKKSDGMIARYRLWPATLALLQQHRTKVKVRNERGSYRVMLSERGTALVEYKQQGDKMARRDLIADAFWDHRKAAGVSKSLKHLRKTGASTLAKHASFKYYHDYYLCHTPSTVSARHYVIPNDAEFFAALDWLREQLFPID